MNDNGGTIAMVSAFLFAGYLLVYAAVANGGRFAATPWDALRFDAYAGGSDSGTSSSSGSSGGHGGIVGTAGAIARILVPGLGGFLR